jgi:DNA mismatch endonuclease (patch repair protein)
MVDMFSDTKRSEIMSRVRSRGNKATELRLIEVFRAYRITGWRRRSTIFGSPDFVFPTFRIALFVDGCFWHGCNSHCSIPKTNRKFWEQKIRRNRTRDKHVNRVLRAADWRVLRIWQHELSNPAAVVRRVDMALKAHSRKVRLRMTAD